MAQMISDWHRRARPHPTARDVSVQIGCHLEEVAEMLVALHFSSEMSNSRAILAQRLARLVGDVAVDLKSGVIEARISSRREVLDSLCDQIVTATGVGVCAGMDVDGALEEVNRSNWSKFVDGKPVFDENGKIAKGSFYKAPNLDGMY